MNKLITLLLSLLFATSIAQTGQKNFIDQNYIEVTGTAEMEIVPNQIFLKIIINEKDIKGKSIEEIENSMLNELTKLEIDVNKDLAVIDLSSNFKYYFIKEKKIYLAKEYELKVQDAKTAGKVIQELELISISNISISKVDHSKLSEFKKEVKLKAIKAAKDKAESLVSEIEQTIGRAIFIEEKDNISVINSLSGRASGVQVSNIVVRGSRSSESQLFQAEIEFEKIKLQYSILVRFELN